MYYHNTSYRCIHLHYVITHIYIYMYVCIYTRSVNSQRGGNLVKTPKFQPNKGHVD